MDENVLKYLYDVLNAVEEIDSYFDGKPKRFEDFNNNFMLRRAVERNVEIMGEAMNRVLKAVPDIQITNARKIVDTRNYIIHGYDSLSADILWSIIINHLPLLRQELKEILGDVTAL